MARHPSGKYRGQHKPVHVARKVRPPVLHARFSKKGVDLPGVP
jgi:hypothetical protein